MILYIFEGSFVSAVFQRFLFSVTWFSSLHWHPFYQSSPEDAKRHKQHIQSYGSVSKPCTPVVHIKIAGKWMFIPLKMVLIGIDPYPYQDMSELIIPPTAQSGPFSKPVKNSHRAWIRKTRAFKVFNWSRRSFALGP